MEKEIPNHSGKQVKIGGTGESFMCYNMGMTFSKDWYKHNKHPRGMLGKKQSDKSKKIASSVHKGKKLSNWHKEKLSRLQRGSNNSNWAGDSVTLVALHRYIERNLPKPSRCGCCGVIAKLDLCNIEPTYNEKTYNRDLSNWNYLCRKCHMKTDGRMFNRDEKGRFKKGGYQN